MLTKDCVFAGKKYWSPFGSVAPVVGLPDMSRYKNDGTMTAVTWVQLPTGLWVMTFNGVASLITLGSDHIGVNPCSISVWFRATGWGIANLGYILSNGKLVFFLNTTTLAPNYSVIISSNALTYAKSAANSISLNTVYCVVVTRTVAGVANLYINGNLSGAAAQGSGVPALGATALTIGNNAGNTRAFNGWIAPPNIYNYVLNQDQINAHFAKERSWFGI